MGARLDAGGFFNKCQHVFDHGLWVENKLHPENALLLSPSYREVAVARDCRDGLFKVVVLVELGRFGRLGAGDLALDDAFGRERMAHHAADLGHIGDTLGEYVAGELQIFVRGLYRFSAPDGVGEGLEALLLRDLGARAALRLVRLVDIFEGALLPARGDLFAKAVRKLALFVDGLQYGLFAGL